MHQSSLDVDDPIAAIYSIITQSGLVLDGAYRVKRDQAEDLMLALERIQIRLYKLLLT